MKIQNISQGRRIVPGNIVKGKKVRESIWIEAGAVAEVPDDIAEQHLSDYPESFRMPAMEPEPRKKKVKEASEPKIEG